MKTRIIYTRFWHDNYISELSSKEKLIFIYLITNEKVNICGIYELPDKYIRFDLDLKRAELDKIKQKFMKDNKFIFINGWVKIINYDIYNRFSGEKNETAKEKELALIPKKIIGYQYRIDRVSSKRDTLYNGISNHNININKKEGKRKIKKSTKFVEAWKDFKEMRKKKNKAMTPKAEELILKELNKLDSNKSGQIAILNQSIMNSWQGVFPLKENQKGGEFEYQKHKAKIISKEELEKYKNTAKEGIKILRGGK